MYWTIYADGALGLDCSVGEFQVVEETHRSPKAIYKVLALKPEILLSRLQAHLMPVDSCTDHL